MSDLLLSGNKYSDISIDNDLIISHGKIFDQYLKSM